MKAPCKSIHDNLVFPTKMLLHPGGVVEMYSNVLASWQMSLASLSPESKCPYCQGSCTNGLTVNWHTPSAVLASHSLQYLCTFRAKRGVVASIYWRLRRA